MLIRKIGAIGRTYRNIHRYTEILGVMFKFGFDDLVTGLRVEQYIDFGRKLIFRKNKEKIERYTRAVRLRMVLEELGPTFIKLGQMLSTRPDLFPADFIHELVKLQEDVPPFPFDQVQKILSVEFGDNYANIFEKIESAPLAAASIGQVHRASLADRQEVVVKIQRPGIKPIIEADLEILMHLATLMERHLEGWDVHKPTEVVEEFGLTIERELDYGIEAANMERLAGLYHHDLKAYVPKVFRHATTPRVLTMEYIDGIPVGAAERLRAAGYDLTEIANRGADMVMEQTMVFGFFHADPHPGNLLVMPGHVICLLDMGMMGRIDRTTRETIADLCVGVIKKDAAAMVKALINLTEWEEEPDRRILEREVAGFVDLYFHRPLKELELGSLLQRIFEIALKHRLRVPSDLILLIKALSTIEGVGQQLDPDFDIIKKAAPFVKRIKLERYQPRRLTADLWEYGAELLEVLKYFPDDFKSIFRLARKGRFKIELQHHGLESLRLTQDQASNRLSFSIVLASLIIGSSVIVHSGIPPTWHGIPLIGLAGYLVAGVMGFWLLITILKKGMM